MIDGAVVNAGAIIAAAIITALLGIVGTMLGFLLRNTKRVHQQVANNHVDDQGNPILMRDDLDEKFEGLADLIKAQGRDIGGLRAEMRQVRVDQTQDRIAVKDAIRALTQHRRRNP